jgi:type VI secretion system protein ImpA
LIGKSIFEVLSILVPARVEAAQVSIGTEQAISLPLGRLSQLPRSEAAGRSGNGAAPPGTPAQESGDAAPAIGEVRLRADAVGLLDDVGAFYRAVEPSSPIPLLTERARSFVGGDFINILKDLIPDVSPPAAKK